MTPRALISRFAFRQVVAELDRVAPNEGILVPLCALSLRDSEQNPCATMPLSALAEILIAAVVLVPQDRQVNQGTRVSVRPHTDPVVNEKVEALTRRFPRLRACAYLHSHPFARGRTWPSSGARCDYDGHMLPLCARNTEAGLSTSFSFIACRTLNGRGWLLQTFALDETQRAVDLGFAQIIDDDGPRVVKALMPSLKSRAEARSILRHWLRDARRRGFATQEDELFDGWQRLKVRLDHGLVLVGLVPIDFPASPPRFYMVDRRRGRTTRYRSAGASPSLPTLIDELVTMNRPQSPRLTTTAEMRSMP